MITDRLIQMVLGGLLALALAFGTVQTLRLNSAKNTAADLTRVLQQERLAAAEAAAAAQENARMVERQRTMKVQEAVNEAEAVRGRARVAAAGARVSGDGLLNRARAVSPRLGGAAGDPTPAAPGAPAEAELLLYDVLAQVVEEARQLAVIADERGAAGQACERAYDALTQP